MSAPNYSPTSGAGTTSTDAQGTTYRFNGTTWQQISSGVNANKQSIPTPKVTTNTVTNTSSSGGGSSTNTTSSSGSSAQDIVNSAVSAFTSLVKKVPSYESVNPFAFDEELAKANATSEYSPYYSRLLSDYTQNVERTKSRSAEDLKTTLDQLSAGKEYYTGVQRRALDTATRSTNEGYAGNGLFFSGVRERDIKELQTESGARVGDYMDTYKYNTGQAELGNTRTIENQDTALSQYSRDNTEAQKAAIAENVLQRKNEALTEYGIKSKNYANEFGTYG